jgi:hypothetical protein
MRIASIMAPVDETINGKFRYQGWQPCIDWCSRTCEGPWLFISEGVFEFELDSDYVLFMLRWG